MPFRFSSITVSRSDSATASTAVGKNLPDGLPRHAADWKIQGDTRLSDAAIDALAELALDIVEADGIDVYGAGVGLDGG